jgi:putative nucleotidyltransferase with HDIG domain
MRTSFGRLEDAKRHVEKLNRMYLSTVETLATAIDAKDEVTHGHIRRVQAAAVGLAREIGITDEVTVKAIEAGALLHDTGKIAVPEHILNKPGRLTPAEFEKMKLHAPIGAEILSSIDFPYPVVPIVRHHHENWDGTGYPDGLRGTDIPIGARILSVVDCFDALTSDRPYRSRMTNEAAVAILEERRGRMYDPAIVDAFVAAHERLMPAEAPMHPAARAVGGARSRERAAPASGAVPTAPAAESNVSEEVLGISSLARALGGDASVGDVGALSWMLLRQVLPCSSMGLFVPDERQDIVAGCYAAGSHAGLIRGLHASPGDGIVGWVAGHRRTAVNAEPALDFGLDAATLHPPLLSALAVPLVHDGALVAVLSVYATSRNAFSEDHARLLDLLAPRLAASIAAVAGVDVLRAPASKLRIPADLTLLKGRRATG